MSTTSVQDSREHRPAEAEESGIVLGGRKLTRREHCHICAFFSTTEEKHRILAPFFKEGLDARETAVHVVDPAGLTAHREWLRSVGIDVEAGEKSGQLDIRPWTETNVVDGKYDQLETLGRYQRIFEEAHAGPFPLLRLMGEMEWALEDPSYAAQLLEYEVRVNIMLRDQPGPFDPVLCTYDLRKFTGAAIVDVMRTHPLIILGGILQENPFYVESETILAELNKRRPVPMG